MQKRRRIAGHSDSSAFAAKIHLLSEVNSQWRCGGVPHNRFILKLRLAAYAVRRRRAISPEVRFLRIFSVLRADMRIVGKDTPRRDYPLRTN
jgi:hypothetical protein